MSPYRELPARRPRPAWPLLVAAVACYVALLLYVDGGRRLAQAVGVW